MKILLPTAAFLTALFLAAPAQARQGRGSGYRQPRLAPGSSFQRSFASRPLRRDEAPAEQAAPQPVAGALIRTAGVATRTEPAQPGYVYYQDMGAPAGWGYAMSASGGHYLASGGVRYGAADSKPGTAGTGSSGGQYQSWTSQINNTTVDNSRAHNNNNNNQRGGGKDK